MVCVPPLRAAALSLLLAAAPLTAAKAQEGEFPTPKTDIVSLVEADSLGAGEYVWHGDEAPDGPMQIVVSLPRQRAYVYRGGELIAISTVSSGTEGHETPIGRFAILEKQRTHVSNKYSAAPMPFMQRLNWYGVAMHAGHVPDHPASHGCIRLPEGFAKLLYGQTKVGDSVYVTEEDVAPDEALALAQAHADDPLPDSRAPRMETAAAD